MKLIESTFINFRCFKCYELKYCKETTVIIGKNGTGKSSVLSGIRRGLSFMFAKPKNFHKNLATSNNAKVKSYDKLEANFDTIDRNYNYPIQNKFKALFEDQMIGWSITKNTMNGGLLTTQYSDALHIILDYYNKRKGFYLPVLAVITDSFPHIRINSGSKAKKIIAQDIIPKDFGYYGWDERTNCIDLWLNRFYKVFNSDRDLRDDIKEMEDQIFLYETRINNKDEHDKHKVYDWEIKIEDLRENLSHLRKDKRHSLFTQERDYIQQKIIEFTKPIDKKYDFINREFELLRLSVKRLPDEKNYTLEFTFKDERVIAFETLPMGYKRIFSIVLDIAYRSYILNENIESEGIVLIDEIELHLHPTLQQEVLQRLRRTFPNIQFIITTHSPIVISNFKSNENNKIIKLEHDGNDYSDQKIDNIYGLDYSTNLSEIMEVDPRSSTIDQYINAYLFLYGKDKKEEAELMYQKLQEYIGEKIPDHLKKEIDEKKKVYKK